MEVTIMREWGYDEALFGIGMSFGITSSKSLDEFTQEALKRKDSCKARLCKVAEKLAHRGGGENKFLESISVSIDVTAPRYWWSEFDTYRVGMTKQSESTMHTITKRHLAITDFERGEEIPEEYMNLLNKYIDAKDWLGVKRLLPESFLQRRLVVTNYKTLQNMYYQRKNHRLPEWKLFCSALRDNLEHFEFIENYKKD